ncbi:MAG: hypothetical protein WA753_23735, partial [Pseudolabrys sp.]
MASRYKTAKKRKSRSGGTSAFLGIHLSKQGIEPAIRIIAYSNWVRCHAYWHAMVPVFSALFQA